ncbi:MAG: hypothetical protein K6G75_06155 [Lachnospiraceae bacterium]|nr:hypothetical protein [Lachnospiraceae bacterium]
MMNEKNNSTKRFVYTVLIGSITVVAVLMLSTLWASRKAIRATDEAVSAVSSFYLEAMADQRARTITNLLAFEDQGGAYYGIYVQNGGNLSDTELGMIPSEENLFKAAKDYLSNESWQKLCTDFAEGKGGSLTLVAKNAKEELCYVPIPDTGWMMAVLIRESVINDQIRGISESNSLISGILIVLTLLSMILFALVLILQLRRISRGNLKRKEKTAEYSSAWRIRIP